MSVTNENCRSVAYGKPPPRELGGDRPPFYVSVRRWPRSAFPACGLRSRSTVSANHEQDGGRKGCLALLIAIATAICTRRKFIGQPGGVGPAHPGQLEH